MLRAEVGVAGEDKGAGGEILTEAVVEGFGLEERAGVEELRAGSDVEVAAVGGEIGFGLVGPEGAEAFADVVCLDAAPVPLGGFGVGGIDVGAGTVVGNAVGRCAVGEVLEPAV